MTFPEYKAIWDANTDRVRDCYAKFQIACLCYNEATRKATFDDYLHALAWRDAADREANAKMKATKT